MKKGKGSKLLTIVLFCMIFSHSSCSKAMNGTVMQEKQVKIPAIAAFGAELPTYQLDWSDEFNGTSVNAANWNFEIGSGGWGNNEANILNNINSTEELHNSFFFILNMAIGGNWPGQTIDNSKLPAKMLVDYVRVYQ